MNVLFVYSLHSADSARPVPDWMRVQYGISYISAVLKAHGHRTRLVVLSTCDSAASNCRRMEAAIAEFDPPLICFTAIATQYPLILGAARHLRRNHTRAFLLIGGVHATLQPHSVMAGPFDALCLGEGEYATLELVEVLERGGDPRGIRNLWIRTAGDHVEKNEARPFLEDLDQVPFPDRDMWKPWIRQPDMQEGVILAGRGCPYDCTYCSNHALRRVAAGPYVRMRSAGNISAEIRHLRADHPKLRSISFEVETIAANKWWLLELCHELKRLTSTMPPIDYATNLRVSAVSADEELFRAMAEANFREVAIGLESGNERLRKQVLRRDYANEDFLKAAELAHKYNIRVGVYNMIGIPGETHAEHMETVRLNRAAKADFDFTYIFFPYPGTELHKLCREQGLIGGEDSLADAAAERTRPFLDLPGYSRLEVERDWIWFAYRVHRGKKTLLIALLRSYLVSHPALRSAVRKLRRIAARVVASARATVGHSAGFFHRA
jgi:radical SAM superfamily enzyme YgiQ (UPF0313 family)